MFNNTFKDNFNFLTSSINNLSQFCVSQKDSYEILKRMTDTLQFVYNKQSEFSLENLKSELIQLKIEANKLGGKMENGEKSPMLFIVKSLIDSLIMEIENEIAARVITRQKESQTEVIKVKIFKSSFSDAIEKEINIFLDKNPNINIVNTLQNIDNNMICITIFYK